MKQLHQIRRRQYEKAQDLQPENGSADVETIEVRIAADMMADLREVAAQLGFPNIQALIKAYTSAGLARDKELVQRQESE